MTTKKRILICGDGNFSFSLALGKLLSTDDPRSQIVADLVAMEGPYEVTCTSFDSREQLLRKYHECGRILPTLDSMAPHGVSVEHGINAWELDEHYPGASFDAVIWNHPHLGTENFNLHRFLMCHFLHSAKQKLTDGGSVVVSVLKGQAVRWDIVAQAAKIGLKLASAQTFVPAAWPGYETRRNRTGGSFQNAHTQGHTGDALESVSLRFQSNPDFTKPVQTGALPRALPNKKPADYKFFCKEPACGKGFRTKQGADTHHKQVHEYKKYGEWSPDAGAVPCSKCGRKVKDQEALWQHEIARHTFDVNIPHPSTDANEPDAAGYGYYPCEICGMSVSMHPDWGMSAHLESLKPIVGLELPCGLPGCDLVFIEQRAMRQHRNFCRVKADARALAEKKAKASALCVRALSCAAVSGLVLLLVRRASSR
ncbi:hypothetical protein DIPPA_06764 [Diplonema papillatum]|nr:hypothetical protein DIPPA_06764 [Diplonema papillatum]